MEPQSDYSRPLRPEFKTALQTGILSPLLKLVKQDRDLLLESRSGYIDIYFKGNSLFRVSQSPPYAVTTHEAFAPAKSIGAIRSEQDAEALCIQLTSIKHKIATHRQRASEIEIEQLMIRMNNHDPGVNSEYFAVDRQGIYDRSRVRIDILGVCWPRQKRNTSAKLELCVMELKLSMGANIGELSDQLSKYYAVLEGNISSIAKNAQAQLRDKIELGLMGTHDRIERLRTLEISDHIKDVRCVVILAEHNPFSKSLNPDTLAWLPFSTIEIFRVGYGLWSSDAYRLINGEWQRPAVFGPKTVPQQA